MARGSHVDEEKKNDLLLSIGVPTRRKRRLALSAFSDTKRAQETLAEG
jgi:hypothetical protein